MKHLEFKVNSQSLKRLDNFVPAANSVKYLTATFTFSEDWSGTTKTAKCRKGNSVYSASIKTNGTCVIPYEVLMQDNDKKGFDKQYFYLWLEGVSSLSPTMTLLTDTEGVTIECEYNRDINAVIARLEALLNN